MPIINATDKLGSFWRFSITASSLASRSLAIMLSLHAPRCQTSGVRSCANPPPLATARHRQPNWERPNGTRSRRSAPLFSMSPNRAILSERSNFYGRLLVGAPGRVAGGHLRRAQPSQVAHGCAPTRERLRGDFLVERNSFRFSVALVPFEQANRSAGKKRNEFRSTASGPRVLGKGQSWLMVAHQPPSPGAEGPPAFRHQENVAPFACQEKRRPELRRSFLLPRCSLVKCIPDRPMHAGVIVMALRRVASRDVKYLQGPEPSVRSSLPRVADRSAWPRNRLPKSPGRRACFPVSSTSFRAPRPLRWRPIFARSSCPTWFSKSLETSRSMPTAASRPIPPPGNGRET